MTEYLPPVRLLENKQDDFRIYYFPYEGIIVSNSDQRVTLSLGESEIFNILVSQPDSFVSSTTIINLLKINREADITKNLLGVFIYQIRGKMSEMHPDLAKKLFSRKAHGYIWDEKGEFRDSL